MEISAGGADADHGQMRHPSLDAGLVADRGPSLRGHFGKDGKFTIEKVPAGTQEFTAWQDANDGRWVFGKTRATRVIKVKVEPDKTTSIGVIKIPAAELEKK